jgi:ribosomal protein S18 acetylase RimI-like enzyme
MDIVMDCLPLDFASLSQEQKAQILDLDAAAFGLAQAWGRHHFELILPGKTELSFYTTDGLMIFGYAIAFRQVSQTGDWVHLSRLAARADFRQRGVGRKLLQQILAATEKAQLRMITAEVDESQAAEAGFYLKLGFQKLTSEDELRSYLKAKGKEGRIQRYMFGQQQVFIKRTV